MILGFSLTPRVGASPELSETFNKQIMEVATIDPILNLDESAINREQLPKLSQAPLDKLPVRTALEPVKPARTLGAGAYGANTYAAGNCTLYAKNKRPDLPNTLGNANTWAIRAKALGWNVGDKPEVGSVGVDENLRPWGHLFYVESVNPDGTINISEMNWLGLGRISNRTISPAGYKFIY